VGLDQHRQRVGRVTPNFKLSSTIEPMFGTLIRTITARARGRGRRSCPARTPLSKVIRSTPALCGLPERVHGLDRVGEDDPAGLRARLRPRFISATEATSKLAPASTMTLTMSGWGFALIA